MLGLVITALVCNVIAVIVLLAGYGTARRRGHRSLALWWLLFALNVLCVIYNSLNLCDMLPK